MLQVSKGSSYYTAWCYPVGAFSGTLCVAASPLSCVPGRLVLKRRAGCSFGILCDQSHSGEFEMQKISFL